MQEGRGTQFDAELLDLFFSSFDDVLAIRRAAGTGAVEQTLAVALARTRPATAPVSAPRRGGLGRYAAARERGRHRGDRRGRRCDGARHGPGLQRSGRDVVVCEQFELGHARGSSHGAARIVRLSYPDALGATRAGEPPALARARGRLRPSAALPARHIDLGDWGRTATRSPPAGRRSPCSTPVRSSTGSGSGSIPATTASSRRTGIVARTQHWQRSPPESRCANAPPRGADRRGRRRRHRGGLRARVAVVTAGAWAPELAGVDATPSSRDRLVLRPRRARPLGDRHDHRHPRLRAPGRPGRRR